MKTRYFLVVLFVTFVLGLTTFAYAQSHERVRDIDHRIGVANDRIDRGFDSGALTRGEADRLKRELNAIRDDEARMTADGRLSRHEKERLDRELDRLERRISRLKHNDHRR